MHDAVCQMDSTQGKFSHFCVFTKEGPKRADEVN